MGAIEVLERWEEGMMVPVEKNIGMPGASRGRGLKYPWHSMEVGDSFLITNGSIRLNPPPSLLAKGWKFSARKVEGGIRVWRVT